MKWLDFTQALNDQYEPESEIKPSRRKRYREIHDQLLAANSEDFNTIIEGLFLFNFRIFSLPILRNCEELRKNNHGLYNSLLNDIAKFTIYKSYWVIHFKDIAVDEIAAHFEVWEEFEVRTITKTSYHQRDYNIMKDIQDIYPNILYSYDGLMLEENEKIDVILPFNHVFWDTFYPPNDYKSLDIIRTSNNDIKSESLPKIPLKSSLSHNASKSGRIFTEEHPYYNVSQELKASLNTMALQFFKKHQDQLWIPEIMKYSISISTPNTTTV